jgi:uncharacterized protein YycO
MPVLTLRFINSRDIISKLITGMTFSLICHTEGMNRSGDGWIGAHAFTGVQERPLDWCKNLTWERRYDIPVTDEQYEAAMEFLESKIGTPYNYRSILGIVIRKRTLTSRDRVDCSDLMLQWLWAAGQEEEVLNVRPGESWMITPEILHLSSLLIGKCIYQLQG